MKSFNVFVVLMVIVVFFTAVQAKSVQNNEMLGFSEFVYGHDSQKVGGNSAVTKTVATFLHSDG